MDYPVYGYKEFLGEGFPFRIKVRNRDNYNRVVHAHENFQFTYVAAGSCEHQIRGKHAVVVKGDFFAIPPYLEHCITPRESVDFEIIEVDFMPVIINENMEDLARMEHFFDFAYIQPLISVGDELLPKLNFAPSNQKLAEELIASMQKEMESKEEGYKLSIKADLLKLLLIAGREFRSYRTGNKVQKTLSTHRQAFYEAIAYMDEHYAEELRLEDAAEIACMAPSYFSSVFKMVKGHTFVDYLNDIRILKAIELLTGTDRSVTDIGFQVGYNNIGHFNHMFKKKTGVTPTAYRKHSASENSRP